MLVVFAKRLDVSDNDAAPSVQSRSSRPFVIVRSKCSTGSVSKGPKLRTS
jgi:hypothetical protein